MKKLLTTAAAAGLALTGATIAAPTPAQAFSEVPIRIFRIANYEGRCLEVENSSTENGARVQLWDCHNQPGSYWRWMSVPGTNYSYLVNDHSRKCLEIENSSLANGGRAQLWDCAGQTGAMWVATGELYDRDRAIEHYTILNTSDRALEVENSASFNGARVQQWSYGGQTGALWRFI
ncbi:RICIN domain-containing protein [Kitasatospora sp. NPDC048239]|uniref:RICIN domain-containing protein n=1 Tax=Kitasatospora sp. NPDC048239 TaxID=3364046 RepID=UPI00371A0164